MKVLLNRFLVNVTTCQNHNIIIIILILTLEVKVVKHYTNNTHLLAVYKVFLKASCAERTVLICLVLILPTHIPEEVQKYHMDPNYRAGIYGEHKFLN